MPNHPVLESHCDTCDQTRPLFPYEPSHQTHLSGITCEWCARDKQPLLCVRCWSTEKQREESAPPSVSDKAAAEFLTMLLESNRRYDEKMRTQFAQEQK